MKKKAIEYLDRLITDDTTKKEIDIISYIKKCVKNLEDNKKEIKNCEWEPFFEKLWSIYPRKIAKQNAKKTFEHKIRGLSHEQCIEKCRAIYKAQVQYIKVLRDNNTQEQYIKHYSSWLNSEVKDSPYFKGAKKYL